MTCIHCNGEHPDGFKFCPVTGKEILQTLKACTNPACGDFNKHVLPPDALFCPRCGQKIATQSTKTTDRNSSNAENDLMNVLFPIYGVTLGTTMAKEVSSIEYDYVYRESTYAPKEGICFQTAYNTDYFMLLSVGHSYSDSYVNVPKKWKQVGLLLGMSVSKVYSFIKRYNLIITAERSCEVLAVSEDRRYFLSFKIYDNRLSNITIEFNITSKTTSHDGESSLIIDKFFPIGDFYLGRTTPKDLEKKGIPVDMHGGGFGAYVQSSGVELKLSAGSCGYSYMEMTDIPQTWKALGLYKDLSYEKFKTQLRGLGFELHSGLNTYTKNYIINGLAKDSSISIEIVFDINKKFLFMEMSYGVWRGGTIDIYDI